MNLFNQISKKLNTKFKYELQNQDPDRPGHDVKYGLDNKLLTDLGGVFDRDFEKGINESLSGDLLSIDLRKAIDSIGEITGQITNDEMLGNIFSNFCIGK